MQMQDNYITIFNINVELFKSLGASPEEILAHALNEAGLLNAETTINEMEATKLCNTFISKKGNYKQSTQLGNLLVKSRIVTLQQLKDALMEQKANPALKLGDILIEMKACTGFDIERCIRSQSEIRKNLEEIDSYQDKISGLRKKLGGHA